MAWQLSISRLSNKATQLSHLDVKEEADEAWKICLWAADHAVKIKFTQALMWLQLLILKMDVLLVENTVLKMLMARKNLKTILVNTGHCKRCITHLTLVSRKCWTKLLLASFLKRNKLHQKKQLKTPERPFVANLKYLDKICVIEIFLQKLMCSKWWLVWSTLPLQSAR